MTEFKQYHTAQGQPIDTGDYEDWWGNKVSISYISKRHGMATLSCGLRRSLYGLSIILVKPWRDKIEDKA